MTSARLWCPLCETPAMADEERIPFAWNDHVNAFESIAVLVGELVGSGMRPAAAFEQAWVDVDVPEDYRDKFWRVAVPTIAEYAIEEGGVPSLAGVDLSEIDLEEGDLRGFDFTGANLAGAYFAKALLDGANFTGADLTDTDFAGASLTGAIMPDGSLHS